MLDPPCTSKGLPERADKSKSEVSLLDGDDEFEEFPLDYWTGKDEDEGDINVWEDNWDDDNAEDDFNIQLRAELEKIKKQEE